MDKQLDPKHDYEKLLSSFKVFDKDNTGKINLLEFKHILKNLGSILSEKEID